MNRTYYRLLHELQEAITCREWCRFAILKVSAPYDNTALAVMRLQQFNSYKQRVSILQHEVDKICALRDMSCTEVVSDMLNSMNIAHQLRRTENTGNIFITPTSTIPCRKQ